MSIAFLLTVSESTQDIFCEELWGCQDSKHHMRFFVCKTIIPMASGFLMDYKKLTCARLHAPLAPLENPEMSVGYQSPLSSFLAHDSLRMDVPPASSSFPAVVFLVFYFAPFYDQLNWQPFISPIANNLNAGCTGLLFWGSLVLVAKMYHTTKSDPSHLLTNIALYAAPFVFLLFVAVNHLRLRLFGSRGDRFLVSRAPPPALPPLPLMCCSSCVALKPASRSLPPPSTPSLSLTTRILRFAPLCPLSFFSQSKVRFVAASDPALKPEEVASRSAAEIGFKFGQPFEVEVLSRVGCGARHNPAAHESLLVASEAVLLVRSDDCHIMRSHDGQIRSAPRRRSHD